MYSRSMRLSIVKPDGTRRSFDVNPGLYTIGSDEGNTIVLPHPDIQWRHAVAHIAP